MSTTIHRIDWNRLALEGVVIIISILLAFAIEAWWGTEKEQAAERAQFARVVEELRNNAIILDQGIKDLDGTISGASELLSWMGPVQADATPRNIGNAFDMMFGTRLPSMPHNATDDLLSSGGLLADENVEIRSALTEWRSLGDELRDNYVLLREVRFRLTEYIQTSVPTLKLMAQHPLMQHYSASKFPLDGNVILTDVGVESMIAEYAFRMEVIRIDSKALLEKQKMILTLAQTNVRN